MNLVERDYVKHKSFGVGQIMFINEDTARVFFLNGRNIKTCSIKDLVLHSKPIEPEPNEFKEGDRVRHEHDDSLGSGRVEEVWDNNKVVVDFKNGPTMTVDVKDIRYETSIEEYEDMYCETCGGTACMC